MHQPIQDYPLRLDAAVTPLYLERLRTIVHKSRASPSILLLAAALSVTVLLALSDFDAARIDGIEMLGEDRGTLSVIVLNCRPCTGGHLMDIDDGMGGEATAFCPATLLPGSLPDGTALRVTVQRSLDDPTFLVVEAFEVISTVND